jgi:hypothetical protein
VSQMAEKLEPCPWCEDDSPMSDSDDGWHYVYCTACYAEGPNALGSRAEAIRLWNTRGKGRISPLTDAKG